MLTEITTVLRDGFPRHPPHTIQRLAELVLAPRAHYRHLAPYLHAVDRIVHITSISSIYPLPPAIPDMSTMTLLSNGVSDHARAHANANANPPEKDPAAAVSWSNPTSTVGSDEALGGALLTPIPWLTRRPSPHAGSATSSPGSKSPQQQQQPGSASPASAAAAAAAAAAHHEIRTESTETIDGPNGMGSIETVTVNLNGPSIMTAGSAAAIAAQQQAQREAQAAAAAIAAGNTGSRPITQGELLRQEQQRGVVPISQLARHAEEIASQHVHNAAAQVAAAQAAAVAAAVGRGAPRAAAVEGAAGEGDADAEGEGRAGDREAGSADGDAAASSETSPANEEEEDEVPHARGPEEIGVGDLGPQSKSTMTFIGTAHSEMQGIDVEAAVGRKSDKTEEEDAKFEEETKEDKETVDAAVPDHETASDAGSETSTKREADAELPEGPAAKRTRASASPESQDTVMGEEKPAGATEEA
jgi:hypothetical protein